MDMNQIKGIVHEALPMRPPRFDVGLPAAAKVRELEDYLLESAFMQAQLEEALFWLDALMEHFKRKVEEMTGWEGALPPKRRERITQAEVVQAKRLTDPPTFEAGSEVKLLRATVLRQIDRLRWEAGQGPVSRAYTLISGG